MRTIFFGTSDFAVPSLRAAHSASELLAVVTQPDRPAGRGHKLTPTPVKRAALELGVQVFEPQRVGEIAAQLEALQPDILALASYGKILPQRVLDIAPRGALNVHPSLLPKYRGATPIQSALRNGDAQTGVSIMLMDAGMDTGPLVLQQHVPIAPEEDYGTLHDRLAAIGADMLAQVLAAAAATPISSHVQHGEASVTKPLTKNDLEIDLSWPAQRIVNTVRALAPQPAARTSYLGETVKILRAHLEDGRAVIDEVIAPNRGRMSGDAYRRSRAAQVHPQ